MLEDTLYARFLFEKDHTEQEKELLWAKEQAPEYLPQPFPKPLSPTMLDMAYLSAKIYEPIDKDHPIYSCRVPKNTQEHHDLFEGCSSKLDQWEAHNTTNSEDFHAALYVNSLYGCSILALRGTDPTNAAHLLADAQYLFNTAPFMYDEAIKYYQYLQTLPVLKNYPLRACTGHSLGGIIAKMIAPITSLSTYTFNSPGVRQCLQENNLPENINHHTQEILTFIAKGDVIGNFRSDNDLGKEGHNHVYLAVRGSKQTPYVSLKQLTTMEGLLYLVDSATDYHGIDEMFEYLKNKEHARTHALRQIASAHAHHPVHPGTLVMQEHREHTESGPVRAFFE